jgi:hypothetical protein
MLNFFANANCGAERSARPIVAAAADPTAAPVSSKRRDRFPALFFCPTPEAIRGIRSALVSRVVLFRASPKKTVAAA